MSEAQFPRRTLLGNWLNKLAYAPLPMGAPPFCVKNQRAHAHTHNRAGVSLIPSRTYAVPGRMRVAFLREWLFFASLCFVQCGSSSGGCPTPRWVFIQWELVAGSLVTPASLTNRPAPLFIPVLVVGVYAVHSTKPLVVGTPPSSCVGGGGLSVLPISYP